MSGITSSISSETLQISSIIINKNAHEKITTTSTKYIFIKMDKIHKLASYANDYVFYCDHFCLCSYMKNLVQEIEDKNEDIIIYVPPKLLTFIKEMITLFKDFEMLFFK